MYCVTISYGKVYGNARQYKYWQPALYRKTLLKNGTLKWRYVKHLGIARRSLDLAKKDALKYCGETVPFIENIRNNKIVEANQ